MTDALSSQMIMNHQAKLEETERRITQLEQDMGATRAHIGMLIMGMRDTEANIDSLAKMLVTLQLTIRGATGELVGALDRVMLDETDPKGKEKDDQNNTATTTTTTTNTTQDWQECNGPFGE